MYSGGSKSYCGCDLSRHYRYDGIGDGLSYPGGYGCRNDDRTDIVRNIFNRENNEYLIGIDCILPINLVVNSGYLVVDAYEGGTVVIYMNGLSYRNWLLFDLTKYGTDPVPTDDEE